MADLGFVAEGVRLSLARSKTDQEAAGQIVGVVATGTSTCPVAALTNVAEGRRHHRWRGYSARSTAMVGSPRVSCLSDRAIVLIVNRRPAAAGVDPVRYSAHSSRAGCATEAAARGVE